jgi:2-oxopent-4-enoate/cis-2-oxohex-4-enoate hydratase
LINPQVFVNPKSGSIRISGSVDIVDADGNVTQTIENPKLCGCGHSKDKPFCDSSHKIFTVPVQQLENAAKSVTAIDPFDPSTEVARAIRTKIVEHKVAAGEKIVGLKVGGALQSVENPNGILIYGFLTDAMQVNGDFQTDRLLIM